MSFDSLGLSDKLVRAVLEKGYTQPTSIQLQSIPVILKGLDIMGKAQTGTGKTAGFTLPLLHLLNKHSESSAKRSPRALILTPTRELAAQVGESVDTYGKYLSLKSTTIFGGVNIKPQISKLRRGIDILVATPGRLLDHANQKTVDLSKIEFLILDEADRMLDMGFIHDVKKIINLLPKKRQNLLFSATFSKDIKKLAANLLNSPILIEVAKKNLESEQVEQLIYPVDRKRKSELLTHLINSKKWPQALVFTRTKHGANRLAK
ncbi:MAG: ATP-dependent RNA helicase RhlE, partial [Candidatus Anoxychlamydiales bacterium]|nr:ATP-dependent RNA helicase RhlE [Candidatus Anoxychlamydiales bacterium]